MMTDQPASQEIDTSRHEQEYQLKHDDTLDIALLANVVGTELTKVDKHAVDNNFKKATKLDRQKIFNKLETKVSAVPQQPVTPAVNTTKITQIKKQSTAPVNIQSKSTVNQSIDLTAVLSKLDSLEQKLSTLQLSYDKIVEKLSSKSKRVTLTFDNDKN